MKYYTFLPRFHASIRAGIKVSTIRAKPKVVPGERFTLRYWTGRPYGSPMGFIGTATCCSTRPITIDSAGEVWIGAGRMACLCNEVREQLAREEGFADVVDMMSHFEAKGQLPLAGTLTRWVAFVATV